MNEIRIAELIELNEGYYAGQSKSILYRCTLVGPFLYSICSEDEEEQIELYLTEWLDYCDEYNLDLVESIIEIYTDGTIQGNTLSLYETFPEYFERVVDFLLGKQVWTPNIEDHEVAVGTARNITAQTLNEIYSK